MYIYLKNSISGGISQRRVLMLYFCNIRQHQIHKEQNTEIVYRKILVPSQFQVLILSHFLLTIAMSPIVALFYLPNGVHLKVTLRNTYLSILETWLAIFDIFTLSYMAFKTWRVSFNLFTLSCIWLQLMFFLKAHYCRPCLTRILKYAADVSCEAGLWILCDLVMFNDFRDSEL